jgi:hypothetical protein
MDGRVMKLTEKLPVHNIFVLARLCSFLHKVSLREEENKMGVTNLALVRNIFGNFSVFFLTIFVLLVRFYLLSTFFGFFGRFGYFPIVGNFLRFGLEF